MSSCCQHLISDKAADRSTQLHRSTKAIIMHAQPSGDIGVAFRNFEVIGPPALLDRGRQRGIAIMPIAELFSLFE